MWAPAVSVRLLGSVRIFSGCLPEGLDLPARGSPPCAADTSRPLQCARERDRTDDVVRIAPHERHISAPTPLRQWRARQRRAAAARRDR